MSCNSRARYIPKQSLIAGVVPTIPASNDHTDGSWLATDIYKGEQFFNVADGILYTRSDAGIEVLQDELSGYKRILGVLDQTSTNAPIFLGYDTINGAYSYVTTGSYLLTLTGAFPLGTVVIVGEGRALTERIIAYRVDNNSIAIKTGNPTAADAVLTNTGFWVFVPSPAS